MVSSKRLTLMLAALMMIPGVMIGGIVFISTWLYGSPKNWENLFLYGLTLLPILLVLIGCILVAIVLSHNITEQLAFLTHLIRTMHQGKPVHSDLDVQHLYQEIQPLYENMKAHAAFYEELTKTLTAIARNIEGNALELRSEDDDFVKSVNILIARLQAMYRMIIAVTEGDFALFNTLDEPAMGTKETLSGMIAELSDLIATARNYTNQMIRANAQINSITTQELQDVKVVMARIQTISQAIRQMAINMQQVAERLQEQSGLLGDASSSIDHTMQSVEDIANNIAYLKTIVESHAPSSQASEETARSLSRLYNATKAIENDANACVIRSQEAAEDAEQGKLDVQQTMAGIHRIQESVQELFDIIRRLGERAEEVSEVLDVITDIADHTNLLAINAAIISAHAGEHGRDFAMIADEIAKFAERTRESTSEIEDLLITIQTEFNTATQAMNKSSNAVSDGVDLAHKAGKTLHKIASRIFSTKEMVARIAAATTEQTRENEHIRAIIEELERLQKEQQAQVTNILWQLMQAIAQIRGISSEQAEGSAKIAATAQSLGQITTEIQQAASQHVTTVNHMVDDVNDIRKLVQRTTLGVEKAAQLTGELFTLGGHLALTMGEFVLSPKTIPAAITPETPLIGFVRRGSESFFDYIAAGIRAEAESSRFQILEVDCRYEATTQVEQVNWLLQQPSLQGLIVCAVDTNVAQKLIQKAIAQEVSCVAADESIAATISIRSGNREGGRRAAELFIGHLAKHTVIGVMVDRTVHSLVRRLEGFRQCAETYPFDIVELYCDMTDQEKREDAIIAGIRDNAGLRGMFLTNEVITMTYLRLLHNGLLPSHDLLAVGYDYTPMTEEAIRKGNLLGAIFQNPEKIGREAFQYLHKLIKKEIHLEDFEERTIYIPTVKVTKETLS